MNLSILYLFFIILFGFIFGSFFNVCIHRIPRKESLIPSSHCPFCNSKIKWWQNIPVFSYLFLRGKCFYCSHSISFRYTAVELLSALFFALILIQSDYQFSAQFARLIFFFSIGIIIFFIDWEHFIIPDSLTIILLISGISFSFLNNSIIDWKASLFGTFMGFSIFLFIAYVGSKILQKDCLGGGDIKLIAAIGSYVGFLGVLVTIFLASILAVFILLVVRYDLKKRFPFGPFLIAAGFVYQLYGDSLITFYLGLWNL